MYYTLLAMTFGNLGLLFSLLLHLRSEPATWVAALPLLCFVVAAYYGSQGLQYDDSGLGVLPLMVGIFAASYYLYLLLQALLGRHVLEAAVHSVAQYLLGVGQSLM